MIENIINIVASIIFIAVALPTIIILFYFIQNDFQFDTGIPYYPSGSEDEISEKTIKRLKREKRKEDRVFVAAVGIGALVLDILCSSSWAIVGAIMDRDVSGNIYWVQIGILIALDILLIIKSGSWSDSSSQSAADGPSSINNAIDNVVGATLITVGTSMIIDAIKKD